MFKVLNGYVSIDSSVYFSSKLRKVKYLAKEQSRLDVRKYSFSQRTINVWNKLSAECVHASSLNMFTNGIGKYFAKAGYT